MILAPPTFLSERAACAVVSIWIVIDDKSKCSSHSLAFSFLCLLYFSSFNDLIFVVVFPATYRAYLIFIKSYLCATKAHFDFIHFLIPYGSLFDILHIHRYLSDPVRAGRVLHFSDCHRAGTGVLFVLSLVFLQYCRIATRFYTHV